MTSDHRQLSKLGIVGALLCALIWAGQAVAVKVGLEGMLPLTMLASRFWLALPILIVAARIKRIPLTPVRGERGALVLNGLALCSQMALFTVGTYHTTSVNSIVLIHTFPFFTAILAHFLLPGHPLRARIVLGTIVAFLGVPLLIGQQEMTLNIQQLPGDVLVLLAAFISTLR